MGLVKAIVPKSANPTPAAWDLNGERNYPFARWKVVRWTEPLKLRQTMMSNLDFALIMVKILAASHKTKNTK